MTNAVIAIYRFFRNHRSALFLTLAVFAAFIGFFGSGIKLEEDISAIVPASGNDDSTSRILKHFRFSDKLVVLLSTSDSTTTPDPELLCNAASYFTDKLRNECDSSCLLSVSSGIPDTLMQWYWNFFYRALPLYLEQEDYRRLAAVTDPGAVKKALLSDLKTLSSPAGFATQKAILRDPLGLTYMALEKLRHMQSDERYVIVNGRIMTKDHRNLLLFIAPANPSSETSKNGKLLREISGLLRDISKNSGGKIVGNYFGAIAMSCGNAERIKKDILLSVGIALILIFLLVGIYFRSLKIPLLSFLPALFGGGLSLALITLTRTHISAIALGIGSVILGLIVDYALYIINHFRKKRDIVVVLKEMSLTIVLCAITTIGAFVSMLFVRSSVLHDLALFSALSVAGAAIFALLFFPHFVTPKDLVHEENSTVLLIRKVSDYDFEKNLWLVLLLLLTGAASFIFLRKVGFEKDMMAMNYYAEGLRNSELRINQVTGGTQKNMYLVSTGASLEQALENHELLSGKIRRLKETGVISRYSGIGFLLPSDALQKERLRRWQKFWTREKIEALENTVREEGSRLKFKDDAFRPFFGWLKGAFWALDDEEKSSIRKTLLSDWISESEDGVIVSSVLQVPKGNEQIVRSEIPGNHHNRVFDRQMLTDSFVQSVRDDFDLLVRLSMVFVTLLLLFSLGRIELAFIAAVPMYFSWLLTLGFMGITGIRFNIFNIIISSFIFGLGVDYSLLMLRGMLHEAKYGTKEITSYKTAVILSSATTIFGVGALFFARHPALHSIALIGVTGIILVVLISFTIQPMIGNGFIVNRQRKNRFPVTARVFVKTIITWGNIVIVAILMTVSGLVIRWLIPVSRRRKERMFHRLFQILCRTYIQVTFPPGSRKIINTSGETFEKPSVIISNHQSLIETPAFLRLHPKILILTSDWVYKSVVFGPVAKLASFLNAEHGIDGIIAELKEKVAEGYSILVFPEAHRSDDQAIQRFHKGAIYLAEKLQIDILPIVVFGTGDFLGRHAFWGRPNAIFMKILGRVSYEDDRFGTTLLEKAKAFRRLYIDEFRKLKAEQGTPGYYRRLLTLNYVYKGPVTEWYFRVKMKLAANYRLFHDIIPKEGKILDIGCGYGFISTMLSLTGARRLVTGVDHDPDKIAVAQNCFLTKGDLRFVCCNITTFPIERQDAFILSDMLHYLEEEQQEQLLEKCIENLEPGGVIVIRDADREKKSRHGYTRMTEFFSTKILNFNKTGTPDGKLHFLALSAIREIAARHGLETQILEEARKTSNTLMVLRQR